MRDPIANAFERGFADGSAWKTLGYLVRSDPSNRDIAARLDSLGLPSDSGSVSAYANGFQDGRSGDCFRMFAITEQRKAAR